MTRTETNIDTVSASSIANDPVAISIRDACCYCGLSRASLYRAISARQLDTRKFGSRTIILMDDLRRFIASLPRGSP
ncbi:helix-turn-helix domain-containing protein [Bosea sp. (in: a-proteobacteria)]|uniref:helix-turn-helix domain-containing protein n=1 Tax=Bosea sp. (in: a-proteobacteria) TaxID=1871050 RepID=UPI003526B694